MKNSALQKTWKSYVKLWKRQPQMGNKQLQITFLTRTRIHNMLFLKKKISKQNTKKKTILENGQKIWADTLPKNIYEWQIKTWKDVQNLASHYRNANWKQNERSPIRMAFKKMKILVSIESNELSYTAEGCKNSTAILEKLTSAIFSQVKYILAI